MISDATKQKFAYEENLIKEYEHWSTLFRYDQVTIGSMIIISKSDKTNLGDLSADEWAGFAQASHDVETWLRKAFGAEKFNYLALMMKDPEVHFHLIPRYSHVVHFYDKEFIDPDWPLATKKVALGLNTETLEAIKTRILEFAV